MVHRQEPDFQSDYELNNIGTSPSAASTATNPQTYLAKRRKRPSVVDFNSGMGFLERGMDNMIQAMEHVISKPINAVGNWWRIRNQLPPTKNGRHISVSLDQAVQIDERNNKEYCSNVISSAIYTVYDFIPRQLIVQFSKLANIYFLFVSILQMIPSWSTTGTYTTIIPLMIFVAISMGREGYDDWCRHRNDRVENNRQTLVAFRDPKDPERVDYAATRWKNIKVGNIVRVLQNEWIPADIVILHSSGIKGQTYVETMALDGETNLKNREVNPDLQEAFSIDSIPHVHATCITEDPNMDLYNFEGSFVLGDKKIALGNSHIIYRGSILRNTASVTGVVVFTGKESKIQQNATQNSRSKSPKLQRKVNIIVILMATFVILLSLFSALYSNRSQAGREDRYWYLSGVDVTFVQNIMGFIIMFNTLIPLSLYVSMEICKLMQKYHMQGDPDMYDPVSDIPFKCQTTSLNEELGQVSYIFSDKTGTLTDNIMLFRKLSVAGYAFIHDLDVLEEAAEEDAQSVASESQKGYLFHKIGVANVQSMDLLRQVMELPRESLSSPRQATLPRNSTVGRRSLSIAQRTTTGRKSAVAKTSTAEPRKSTATIQRHWTSTANPQKPQDEPSTLLLLQYMIASPRSLFAQKAKFFLLALALCHSASPEVDLAEEAHGDREIEYLGYQAASPDELALVSAARDLGFLVIDRQYNSITLRTYPEGFDKPRVDEVYEVLDTIEFTSTRKRMSNVIKFPDGRICLFTKGADNVMLERLNSALVGAARSKMGELQRETTLRRSIENDIVIKRRSTEIHQSPLGARPSLSMDPTAAYVSLDQHLREQGEDQRLQETSRRSISMRQKSMDSRKLSGEHTGDQTPNLERYSTAPARRPRSPSPRRSGPMQPETHSAKPKLELDTRVQTEDLVNNRQILDTRFVIEKTLEHVDEFSTEGLRTLLYGHRFLHHTEYEEWKQKYDEARLSLTDRQKKIDEVGELLERDYELTGATAIEDKLQKGVPETIERLRRASIKLWMLTGDKRETAINIGYSCRLIKDYSSVIILKHEDDVATVIMASLEELQSDSIAHCVVVVDGHTLSMIERDVTTMSLFIDLSLRVDSVICCRASPAQKAAMVSKVRERMPKKVTLAIGDGANDISMIKAADLGIGIAGKEGLQAARSSDYSFAQFRFLQKLLLVQGRWNYVRTCKYILATFYKEFLFYMGQVVFQRYALFTGTSVYESWSISMFNTLFTSLPVIALGVVDQDLSASTLIAVPELYKVGQLNMAFNVKLFLYWLLLAMSQCVCTVFLSVEAWGKNFANFENDLYPLGVIIFATVVIIICFKLLFFEIREITLLTGFCAVISIAGYLFWNLLIGGLNSKEKAYFIKNAFLEGFGRHPNFWACIVILPAICLLFDLVLTHIRRTFKPTDVDVFEVLESDPLIRKRMEDESQMELEAGWECQAQMRKGWDAIRHGQFPAEPLPKNPTVQASRRRRRDVWIEKLTRGRSSSHYEREIDDILERRERELEHV